ncbi:MAG: nitrogen regulation protein NR(II), partial [Gammaproteobacteria bacterium]|nr:nitrogen regulation protein NR(II) [Gammaproteobacteria bacterium]
AAVLLVDQDLRLKYLNNAAEILLEISAQRILNSGMRELFRDERLAGIIESAFASGSPILRRSVTLELIHGRTVKVDLTASPVTDTAQPTEVVLEMTQIDRQLRIEREEGLLAQGHATRALVRGLAHEIKNPLGGLRGAAQLLERELHNEELKEYTQIIISEADRLQGLMDQMLGPNRLPTPKMINIHEALERVRQVVNADFGGKVSIVRDYDPSIPDTWIDLDQLIQSLMNLIRNAAQAVTEMERDDHTQGEIILKTRTVSHFTISSKVHKLVAKIDIIDNGPGIDESMSESLFLPMITGRIEGTGLGLPIAQSLINLNGGLVEWQSRPGKTQFTVLLPITDEKE